MSNRKMEVEIEN